MNSIRTFAAAITTAMITCGATAATISFSATPAAQNLDINQTLNLGMFNTSLGTLTNVAMQFNGNSTYGITLINEGAEPVSGQGTVFSLFSWFSTLGALNGLLGGANDPLFVLSASTGLQTIGGGVSATFSPLIDFEATNWDAQLDLIFSAFQVAGLAASIWVATQSLS